MFMLMASYALAAPYNNYPKTGVLQEISKYQVTAENKHTVPKPHVPHSSMTPSPPSLTTTAKIAAAPAKDKLNWIRIGKKPPRE